MKGVNVFQIDPDEVEEAKQDGKRSLTFSRATSSLRPSPKAPPADVSAATYAALADECVKYMQSIAAHTGLAADKSFRGVMLAGMLMTLTDAAKRPPSEYKAKDVLGKMDALLKETEKGSDEIKHPDENNVSDFFSGKRQIIQEFATKS